MELREDLAPTGERVLFVACDKELLDAAEATRFPVFNPLA